MSHCRARRKYGACYGTLYKQHSSPTSPSPNLALFASKVNAHHNKAENSSIIKDKSSVDALAAALDKNERGKLYEFCVLVGNTMTCYESLTSFRRGDHPSSEIRIVGASAWNPPVAKPRTRSFRNFGISSPPAATSPTATSTDSSPTFRLLTHAGTHIYCSAQATGDRDLWLSALHSGLEITYAGYEGTLTALKILTSQCGHGQDENNEANSSGRNGNIDLIGSNEDEEKRQQLAVVTPRPPKSLMPKQNNGDGNGDGNKNGKGGGEAIDFSEPIMITPPVPQRKQRGKHNGNNSMRRLSTMNTYNEGNSIAKPTSPSASSSHGMVFQNPYEYTNNNSINGGNGVGVGPISKFACLSCGRYPPESLLTSTSVGQSSHGTPLPHYGMEHKVSSVCQPCMIGQGVLRHVNSLTGLYACDAHERVALMKGNDMAKETVERVMMNSRADEMEGIMDEDDSEHDHDVGFGERSQRLGDEFTNVIMTPEIASSVVHMITNPKFAACRRRSSALDHISSELESGQMGAAEFLEELSEYAKEAIVSSTFTAQAETIKMKKEALMVSGDMRAAIKMLHEYALPKKSSVGSGTNMGVAPSRNTEMLSCILEFFLDLCEEGELSSIAFFWPQLCQIHLQMLPPIDSESLARIELVEDFLLTVCTHHSIHLALETVWSCVADLEESLGTSTASASCRRRRFALMRFVSELESLVFDMDGGWGSGNVCLRGMLMPSDHQNSLIRNAMGILQMHRRFSSHHLNRSARLEKLNAEAEKEEQIFCPGNTDTAETEISRSTRTEREHELLSDEGAILVAERKYRIARNAEYFSTQLMFARRLGDIAERLRFMGVEDRSATLEEELQILNSSGRLGGDPLNVIQSSGNDFVNVMKIPKSEGHVFRSKERTPVLLLMEVVKDENLLQSPIISSPTKGKKMDTVEKGNGKNNAIANQLTSIPLIDMDNKSSSKVDTDVTSTIISQLTKQDANAEAASALATPEENAESESNDEDEVVDLINLQTPKAKKGVLKSSIVQEVTAPSPKAEIEHIVANVVQEKLKVSTSTSTDFGDEALACESFLSCQSEMQTTGILEEEKEVQNGNVKSMEEEQISASTGSVKEALCIPDLESEVANVSLTPTNSTDNEDLNPPNEALEAAASEVKDESKDDKTVSEPSEQEETQKDFETKSISITPEKSWWEDEAVESASASPIKEESSKHNEIVSTKQTTDNAGSNSNEPNFIRKVSAFGALHKSFNGNRSGQSHLNPANLTVHGEGRRQVLTAIFTRGMRSSNNIARGVAPAARRAVQAMDRKRAQILINNKREDGEKALDNGYGLTVYDEGWNASNSTSILNDAEDTDFMAKASEEEECIEAIRLLLVQNSVALGKLTPETAVRALGNAKLPYPDTSDGGSLNDSSDAGEIDPRLAGCGAVSHAVLSALQLWKEGHVSNAELLDLVHKDLQFTQLALPGAENESKLKEDSVFWGRFAFGERWAEKKARIQASSVFGSQKGWDLTGVIVKSNDDLRQEAFAMQLITLAAEAFDIAGLELWMQPYRILATGRTTGVIELVRNGMSFDSLKKRPGYSEGGLLGHFKKMSECAADPSDALKTAKKNFVRSLAAYSLISYLFLFKDRHNGNLLLDTAGHVIHIDFGFIFGIAPGGSFSLEQSVPFKLTEEMIEVMDGLGSVLFSEFVTLFCCGFLALQTHCETFVNIVEITCQGSTFNCFQGKDQNEIVSKLRERFCSELGKEETVCHAMELIRLACNATGTKQYDYFQYMSQGIAA